MIIKKIYLFRHGETSWNISSDDTVYTEEAYNVNLNKNGVEQANIIADYLKLKNIKIIYSSPLKRALDTAEILKNKINNNIIINQNNWLLEYTIYKPVFSGKTKLEIKNIIDQKEYKKCVKERDENLDWRPYSDFETKREARERIYNTIINICKNDPNDIIAISTHCSVITELIRSTEFSDDSKIDNCEIVEACYDGKKISIIKRMNLNKKNNYIEK